MENNCPKCGKELAHENAKFCHQCGCNVINLNDANKYSYPITLYLCIWGIIIIVNQVLFFNSCFKPHCIIAAIPHTFVLTLVLLFCWKKRPPGMMN